MLDQLFNSKTRVKVLSLFQANRDNTYYLQEIVRLTKTDPASIHRELKTLEEINLLDSTTKGNQKYFKINTQNPYWKNIEQLIAIYKNNDQSRWLYYTDSKDIYPLIHFSTVDEGLNQVFFKKIGVELGSYDFASLNTDKNTDMWLKYHQCNEIEQKFKKLFFENPEQILSLCQESFQAGANLQSYTKRWQKLSFSSLDTTELAQELQGFIDIHGQFEIYHWLHSILETGNLVVNQELQIRMKATSQQDCLSNFGFLTNAFVATKASTEYDSLLNVLSIIQSDKLAKQFFNSTELRLIQKSLWEKYPEIYLKIKKHASQFGYLGFGRKGPAWTENYFIEILKHLIDVDIEVSPLKLKNQIRISLLKKNQAKLEENFYLDLSSYFKAYRACIETKIFRKEVTHFCYELLSELLTELSNKTNCTVSELQQIYQSDLSSLLIGEHLDKESLNKRATKHFLLRENHVSNFYVEPECSGVLDRVQLPKSHANIFYGKCFVAGRARGKSLIYQSKIKEIPHSSIIIIDSKIKNFETKFLEKNLENILGVIFINKPNSITQSILFTRQYNIPCVVDLDFKDFEIDNKLIDLDSTYGKVAIIQSA